MITSDIGQAASRSAGRLSIVWRAVVVWIVICLVETAHGIARIALLQPIVGDFRARQIAVFIASLLVIAVTFIFRNWLAARSLGDCLLVGAIWVVLTVCFEFGVGRLALDLSWDRLLSDYDLSSGGLMPIGLLIMFFSPLIGRRFLR